MKQVPALGSSFPIADVLIRFETPCFVSYNPAVDSWLLLKSGPGAPAFNMALDEALLEAMARLGRPVLRFYGWTEPAATFGYFQKYAEVERATPLRPLIRRPTGGGIVPHDAGWTYSLAFPPGHEWHSLKAEESYRRIHEWIQAAFTKLDVATELAPARHSSPATRHSAKGCFVGYEKFDLLWQGRKIAGAAQRRNKLGLLIQGSVQPAPISIARADWHKAMCDVGRMRLGVEWSEFEPDDLLREQAEFLVGQKYSQPAYNRKR
jgi:lipoate-protein ligase A